MYILIQKWKHQNTSK